MHRRLFLALPVGLLSAGNARAANDPAGASAFIKSLLTNVLAVVNGNAPDKSTQLQALMDANIDIADIAQFCVGRFWRTATPAQQAEYRDLFHKVLTKNVIGRIGQYQGTSFEMGGTLAKDDAVAVTTTLNRPNNAPNRVDWMVADLGGPKVIDLIAEGTSLRLTQRSDYLAFLGRNSNGLQALIDALKAQATG